MILYHIYASRFSVLFIVILQILVNDCTFFFLYIFSFLFFFFFFSSRRRHTRLVSDWSSDVCSSDLSELMARYYLGLALSSRGDKNGALQLWEGVLADAPPNVPWRGALINQMAALRSQTGAGAPFDPAVMVARLASRLETDPNDLDGWLMLIRSYNQLGDKEKAAAALAKARSVFANQADAQAALTQVAQQNSLN